ncbi:anther-specific protein BCP1 [Rhodamnia argentea]|uniref:Anther-specific protein BCP1 n=1 Tax=Rhodamnia argentea TaxID=178133 RepID=A0A8B8Q4Q3_9MYRT|nr:anther-specific protein BCP1 [Rhodamnia argentea]
MSPRVLFICLASIAVLGLASAAEPTTTASAPTTSSPSSSSAFAPVSDSAVGNTDDGSGDDKGDDALAAPVGSPVPAGVFPSSLDASAPGPGGSGAFRAGISASIAIAAMIGHFF